MALRTSHDNPPPTLALALSLEEIARRCEVSQRRADALRAGQLDPPRLYSRIRAGLTGWRARTNPDLIVFVMSAIVVAAVVAAFLLV
jgi:predicted transcriptional regulator